MLILLLVGIGAVMLAASTSPGRATTGDRVIGAVGEQEITESRYLETVQAVETNLETMRAEIESGSPNQPFLEQFVQLIEEYGAHNVALGSLIQELSLYEFALDQGVSVSPVEVAERVEQDRRLVDTVEPPPDVVAWIESVGPERFWTEVYPPLVERDLTINRLWQGVTAGVPDQAEQARIWRAVQQHAVGATTVEWPDATDSGAIRADLESALAFLTDYWTLT